MTDPDGYFELAKGRMGSARPITNTNFYPVRCSSAIAASRKLQLTMTAATSRRGASASASATLIGGVGGDPSECEQPPCSVLVDRSQVEKLVVARGGGGRGTGTGPAAATEDPFAAALKNVEPMPPHPRHRARPGTAPSPNLHRPPPLLCVGDAGSVGEFVETVMLCSASNLGEDDDDDATDMSPLRLGGSVTHNDRPWRSTTTPSVNDSSHFHHSADTGSCASSDLPASGGGSPHQRPRIAEVSRPGTSSRSMRESVEADRAKLQALRRAASRSQGSLVRLRRPSTASATSTDSQAAIPLKTVASAVLAQFDTFVPRAVLSRDGDAAHTQTIAQRVAEYETEVECTLAPDCWSRAARNRECQSKVLSDVLDRAEEELEAEMMRRATARAARQYAASATRSTSAADESAAKRPRPQRDKIAVLTRDVTGAVRPMPRVVASAASVSVCDPAFDDQTAHRLWVLPDASNMAAVPPANDGSSRKVFLSDDKGLRALLEEQRTLLSAAAGAAPSTTLTIVAAAEDGSPTLAPRLRPTSGDLLTRRYQEEQLERRLLRPLEQQRAAKQPPPAAPNASVASKGPSNKPPRPGRVNFNLNASSHSLSTSALDMSASALASMKASVQRSTNLGSREQHLSQRRRDAALGRLHEDVPPPTADSVAAITAEEIASPDEADDGDVTLWEFEKRRIREQCREEARRAAESVTALACSASSSATDVTWDFDVSAATADLAAAAAAERSLLSFEEVDLDDSRPSVVAGGVSTTSTMVPSAATRRAASAGAHHTRGGGASSVGSTSEPHHSRHLRNLALVGSLGRSGVSRRLREKLTAMEHIASLPTITVEFFDVSKSLNLGADGSQQALDAAMNASTCRHHTLFETSGSVSMRVLEAASAGDSTREGSEADDTAYVEQPRPRTGIQACAAILLPLDQENSTEALIAARPVLDDSDGEMQQSLPPSAEVAARIASIRTSAALNAVVATTVKTIEDLPDDDIRKRLHDPLAFDPAGAARVTPESETNMPPQELHLYQLYCATSDTVIIFRPISAAVPSMYAGNFFVPRKYCDEDGIPLPVHEIGEDLVYEEVRAFTSSECRIKGKGIGVSLKSSPYSPIEGFIPINPSLSKTYSEARKKERQLEDNLMRATGKISTNLLKKIRTQRSMFGAATSVAMREIEQSLRTSDAKMRDLLQKYHDESALTVDKLGVSERYIDVINEFQFLGKAVAQWRGMELFYRQLSDELDVDRNADGVPYFYVRRGAYFVQYDPVTNELHRAQEKALLADFVAKSMMPIYILTHRSFVVSPSSQRIEPDPSGDFIIGPDFDGFAYSAALHEDLYSDVATYVAHCEARIAISNLPSMGLVSARDAEHIREARALTEWKQNHGYECTNTAKTQEITDGYHVAVLPTMEVRTLASFIDIIRFYRECWLRRYPLLLNPNWKVVLCNETKMPVIFGDEMHMPIVDDCGMALAVHAVEVEGQSLETVKAEAAKYLRYHEEIAQVRKGVVGSRAHRPMMLGSGHIIVQMATVMAKKALAEKFYALRRWLLMPPLFVHNRRCVVDERTFRLLAPPVKKGNDARKGSGQAGGEQQSQQAEHDHHAADPQARHPQDAPVSAAAADTFADSDALFATVPISVEFELLRERRVAPLLAAFDEACTDFDTAFIEDCGTFTKLLRSFVEFQTVGDPTGGTAVEALSAYGALGDILLDADARIDFDEVNSMEPIVTPAASIIERTMSLQQEQQRRQQWRRRMSGTVGRVGSNQRGNGSSDSVENSGRTSRTGSGLSESIHGSHGSHHPPASGGGLLNVTNFLAAPKPQLTSGAFFAAVEGMMHRHKMQLDREEQRVSAGGADGPGELRTVNSFLKGREV